MVQRLARSGLHAHVVSDGTLHRVRLGPYTTRATADGIAARVRRVAGTAPFVVKTP